MNIRYLIFAFLLVGCTPESETPVTHLHERVDPIPVPIEMQGKWSTGFHMGVTEHMITRKETSGVNVSSYIDIACHYDFTMDDVDFTGNSLYGREYYGVGIYVQFDNQDVEKPMLIIDQYTEFDLKWITQDCRVCLDNYYAMWNMLRNATTIAVRSEHGVVKEFPVTGVKEELPEEPCAHVGEIYP